ncbi:ABC transporter permease subunit [Proteiniclasticum sp.]|uniref:ABC transporter permease subunit n=1 Tax=Proteiniclasticum sp. TaxID=2053595 RepID=UPI00289BF6F4|nr:ABC transporter permease subunit [Proteiniclasticum sp.]
MNSRQRKLLRIILGNVLLLFSVIAGVIVITGVPINFDIIYEKGRYQPNMPMAEIYRAIRSNFEFVISGKARDLDILGESVGSIFNTAAGRSGIVLFFGILLAVIIGIPKGIIDSRKKDRAGTFKMLQSLVPLSVPDILTIGLVQILALYLFKNGMTFLGIGPIEFKGDQFWYNSIYPILSISILPAAYIARTTATAIEEGFSKPYILAARGKGCSRYRIIKNHLMKSVVYEVLSVFPTILTMMFSSLVIVERLFYYRGIGYHMIEFYTSSRIDPVQGNMAFSYFMTIMAVVYFFILLMFNVLKDVVIPQVKS